MSGYRKVSIESLPNTPNPTREKKEVDVAVDATEFGFNVYTADPGERVPWGYHRHPNHEELFYVIEGALAFETPDGTDRVEAGEAFFVPRDHPNAAHAVGDRPTRFVAVGAPKEEDGAIIEEECPVCGEITDRTYDVCERDRTETTVYILRCADCGAETDRFEN